MRKIFVDTGYWVAVSNPRDSLHGQAVDWSRSVADHDLITSEIVLAEFLNGASRQGQALRHIATELVRDLYYDSGVEVVPQTSNLFQAALRLYGERLDKGWSHTDCSSFCIMQERGIREALAHDKHFEQAGFVALLR